MDKIWIKSLMSFVDFSDNFKASESEETLRDNLTTPVEYRNILSYIFM